MSTGTAPSTARPPRRRSPATRSRRTGAGDATQSYRQRQLETSRYGIVYDIDGPRVRLGVGWFVLCVVALFVGLAAVTAVFAAVAALAAAQTATTLRARWRRPDRRAAALLAAAVPVGAAFGTALAGAVLMLGSLGVVVAAAVRRQKGTDPLVNAGAAIRAALLPALAALAVVVLFRIDIGAAVTIVLLVSAYEFGDFLVGTGASNPVEGPASGILATMVVTAALAVGPANPPPFENGTLWLFGLVAGLLAPAGQVVASAILPRAGAPARALRRLDSYLVAAPVWVVLMWAGVHA